MGLDQYLSATKYVSGYSFFREEDQQAFNKIIPLIGATDIYDKKTPSMNISFTVMYWRKANAIHNWFVRNVQKGKDDCGKYYVRRKLLEDLLAECIKERDTQDSELIPASGFFFGSPSKDEWFYEDINRTIEELTLLLENTKDSDFSFEYSSSW